jgi:hypothetical protein
MAKDSSQHLNEYTHGPSHYNFNPTPVGTVFKVTCSALLPRTNGLSSALLLAGMVEEIKGPCCKADVPSSHIKMVKRETLAPGGPRKNEPQAAFGHLSIDHPALHLRNSCDIPLLSSFSWSLHDGIEMARDWMLTVRLFSLGRRSTSCQPAGRANYRQLTLERCRVF